MPKSASKAARTVAKDAIGAEQFDEAATRIIRIAAVIRAIPLGRVMSYAQVAARAELPGRARLVARVLSQSGVPDLPWQRVVRADGSLAVASQKQRLQKEGVRFHRERVAQSAWLIERAVHKADSLDALLWQVD